MVEMDPSSDPNIIGKRSYASVLRAYLAETQIHQRIKEVFRCVAPFPYMECVKIYFDALLASLFI